MNDEIRTDIIKDTESTVWIRTKGAAMGIVKADFNGNCKFAGDVAVADKNGDKGWRHLTLSFWIDYGERDSPAEIETQVLFRLRDEIRHAEKDLIIKQLRTEVNRLRDNLNTVDTVLEALRCKNVLEDLMQHDNKGVATDEGI